MEEIGNLLPHLIKLVLLLSLSFIFSGSETALCALSQVQIERMREDKRKSSIAIVKFFEDSRRLFITVLLGNDFVNIAFATVISSLIYEIFGENKGLAVGISTTFITIMLLIFGEITPKVYAVNFAEKFSSITARPLWLFSIIITPLRIILRYIVDLLISIFIGKDELTNEKAITAEEFKAIVINGEVEGVIEKREKEIIEGIFELNDIEAKEIMIPRTDVIGIEFNQTIREALNTAKECGHSRIPVYHKQMDSILGIFQVKDWPLWRKSDVKDLTIHCFLEKYNNKYNEDNLPIPSDDSTLFRMPFFVPETKKLDSLIKEMTTSQNNMAILLDEYGGVSGLVTMEDIVEVLVGEIADEYDEEERPVIEWIQSEPPTVKVSGKTSIRTINKRLETSIDETIADTIGGYVTNLFGLIPPEGSVKISEDGTSFEVLKVDGARIEQILIRKSQEQK